MDCRRVLFAAFVACGCTKSNPDFDENESGGTRAADDDSNASDDPGESEVGSLDGTATVPMTSDDSSGDTGTSIGTVASSEGPVECAEMAEFDWTVELWAGVDPAEIVCDAPYALQGMVASSKGDALEIVDCSGACECEPLSDPIEVYSPDLVLPTFAVNSCVRVEIEWSEFDPCRPVGFVVFEQSDAGRQAVVMAGQDVTTLPQAVGGAAIGFSTISPCACADCCAETGIAALEFLEVQIPEGIVGHINDLLGDDVLWEVEVFEAHVYDDCTRALSWWGFPD